MPEEIERAIVKNPDGTYTLLGDWTLEQLKEFLEKQK